MFVSHYNPSLKLFSYCSLCATCENQECAVLHAVCKDQYFGEILCVVPDVQQWDSECAAYSEVINHE